MTLTAHKPRVQVQAKRIRMARAAMQIPSTDKFAELVSAEFGVDVSGEMLRRIEKGERDVEYGLLRAIADVVRDAIMEETTTPLEWLAGGGEPVFVNPGYVKGRWRDFVIPRQDVLFAVA